MKNWFPDSNEFYIGYLPNGPDGVMSAVRKIIYLLSLAVICVASLLALKQKTFSPANFEYGVRAELEGFIFDSPVPHLLVPLGQDVNGEEIYQTVLLVGFGKAGVRSPWLASIIKRERNGANVRLAGSLIYGDGKTLLQIDEESNIEFLGGNISHASNIRWEENMILSGEIVDPKCYFGVMKPGEGKAHRSCAIRCIAGGIPPVFNSDSLGYFLMMDEDNEPVSMEIVNIVGDHITLHGDAMRWNDWTILRIDSEGIVNLSAAKKWKANMLAFQEGMTQCK